MKINVDSDQMNEDETQDGFRTRVENMIVDMVQGPKRSNPIYARVQGVLRTSPRVFAFQEWINVSVLLLILDLHDMVRDQGQEIEALRTRVYRDPMIED